MTIDVYNYYMKDVDQTNQLRTTFMCHHKQNYQTWWPLFFFLINVVHTNVYLLWKWSNNVQNNDSHKDFISALYN